ncbi:uncharacterized protein [Rutidosis leptorrhynchoides]|uniref:uncharacterized protein n=1 Tax=Rutidosis leptorrhynchoides TaxID=125765 RepID=UPI003A9A542B
MATNSTLNPLDADDVNSPNHPLFLHQQDHPGLILISKKLTAFENYSSWRRLIMIALNAKNKLKIVNGEFTETHIQLSHKALWDQLQEHYSQLDGHKIFQLTTEITELKQTYCTIEVYYQKLKGFWDELDALETPYTCICPCTCENGKVNGERDQMKRLMKFLMGLDECYSNVRGQILLMQPLPSVAKAYSMLRQEEKQREYVVTKPSISAILSAQSSNRSYSNNTSKWNSTKPTTPYTSARKSTFKKGIICGNCGFEGHTKEECYKLVGYPIGHPFHDKYKPPQRSQGYSKDMSKLLTW